MFISPRALSSQYLTLSHSISQYRIHGLKGNYRPLYLFYAGTDHWLQLARGVKLKQPRAINPHSDEMCRDFINTTKTGRSSLSASLSYIHGRKAAHFVQKGDADCRRRRRPSSGRVGSYPCRGRVLEQEYVA